MKQYQPEVKLLPKQEKPPLMAPPLIYQQQQIALMQQQQMIKQQQMIRQQQKQPATNCIFYYQQCQECATFIKAMNDNQFISHFKLIPLDTPQYHHLAQKNIVHPTLIVVNLPKPFEGIKAVYQWLETARTFKMNQLASLNATAAKINAMKMTGPIGFNDKEMGNGADPYTFVKIDNPLAQNYYFHGTDQVIMTAPEEDKLDKKDIDNKIHSLANTRKKEDDNLQKVNEIYHEKILNAHKK
jgi:hypothetical protein